MYILDLTLNSLLDEVCSASKQRLIIEQCPNTSDEIRPTVGVGYDKRTGQLLKATR